MRRRLWLLWLLPALLAVACGEPPAKEMDQAQAALDAARAGGAEQFAGEAYTAAVAALAHSREAVTQRDYRLALNHALDSRERAEAAARQAQEARAARRAEVAQALADLQARMTAARAQLLAAPKTGAAARLARRATRAVASLEPSVQESDSLLKAGDYAAAEKRIADVRTRLAAALAAATPAPAPPRRRRRAS